MQSRKQFAWILCHVVRYLYDNDTDNYNVFNLYNHIIRKESYNINKLGNIIIYKYDYVRRR